jgi:signal transduction histidine kinase
LENLDVKRRTIFFRVAQEALTNVVRHSEAEKAQVVLFQRRKAVVMEIKDNGKSFDVPYVLQGKGKKHLGVLGMRERVEMVGGTFKIESSPGHGTLVFAEIPIPIAAR